MPRIPEYFANQSIDAAPIATGARRQDIAASEEGNSIRQGANALGTGIERYEARQEISAKSAEGATLFNGLSQSWNATATNADPNDTNTAQDWEQKVLEPQLQKYTDGADTPEGRQFATDYANRLRLHFSERTGADMAALSGAAIGANLDTSGNQLSAAVMGDPTALAGAQNLFAAGLEAQIKAHNLTPDVAARVRADEGGKWRVQIAVSAGLSMARNNPDALRTAVAGGQFDKWLDGEQQQRLLTFAGEQQRAAGMQARAQEAEAQKQQHAAFAAQSNKIVASFVQPDGSLAVPPDAPKKIVDLALMPGAPPGEVRAVADMSQRILKEHADAIKAVSDPHTYEDFSNRIALPSDSPNAVTDEQIVRARADGELSDKDYNFFRGALATMAKDPAYKTAQQQFKTFLRGIKSSITNSNILMGRNDPAGDQKYLQFQQRATGEFERAYKAGTWRPLLDRNAKGSLWHEAVPYMTGEKESADDMAARAQGSAGLAPSVHPSKAPKHNPGETPDAYLKRIGQ